MAIRGGGSRTQNSRLLKSIHAICAITGIVSLLSSQSNLRWSLTEKLPIPTIQLFDSESFPIRASLLQVVDTAAEKSCPQGLHFVNDTRSFSYAGETNSNIPRIVHVTSRSRCMTKEFHDNVDKWRFPGYSLLFHNDQAVDSLINRHWPEFPELQKAAHCLLSGAGKADLWRALVLYEYGGIYTDIDNAPTSLFVEEISSVLEQSEAYFVIEQGGWLSQYFMAATPRHPLLWLVIHKIIQRLYSLNDVDNQYVPRSSGPGALKYAFIAFMNDQGPNIYEGAGDCNKNRSYKYGHVTAGNYTGWDNWTVTAVGDRSRSNDYVVREIVKSKKAQYSQMNMTHFTDERKGKQQDLESCFRRIYGREAVGR